MATTLTSRRYQVEGGLHDAIEFCFEQGWTDGLPVVPPTPDRVQAMLEAAGLDPGQEIAVIEHRAVRITAEKVAINAVMAGCRPEYMPVVVAAVEALGDPLWSYHGPGTSTAGAAVLMIVNGPIRRELDINCGDNLFGPGWRANLTIGRAVRLVMRNVCGSRPGTLDRGTLGHPGKFTYCLAENETASPWEPLHVVRGFARDEASVTVVAAEAPHNVNDHGSTSAEALLGTLAGTAATPGNNNVYLGGEPLVLLGPEHAATFAASGWSKRDVKRAYWERARVPLGAFSRENLARFAAIDPARFRDPTPDFRAALAAAADDVLVVVAGGPGKHSAVVPTFGATRAVTRVVVW